MTESNSFNWDLLEEILKNIKCSVMRISYNMKWNTETINNSDITTKSNSYNWDLLEEILKKIKCSVWGSPITWNEILRQLIT